VIIITELGCKKPFSLVPEGIAAMIVDEAKVVV
jgi:hypothetical protein